MGPTPCWKHHASEYSIDPTSLRFNGQAIKSVVLVLLLAKYNFSPNSSKLLASSNTKTTDLMTWPLKGKLVESMEYTDVWCFQQGVIMYVYNICIYCIYIHILIIYIYKIYIYVYVYIAQNIITCILILSEDFQDNVSTFVFVKL